MKLFYMINKNHDDGTLKTVKEIEKERKELLISYRKDNRLLRDKLYDLEHNSIPIKDTLIQCLKDRIEKLEEESKNWEILYRKNKPYLF